MRSQSVVSRRVAGETLIVPVRGKVGDLASIYSFNETGSLIWQSLETPKGLSELITTVENEYVVEQEQAERDVMQFLNDMLSVGLVEARPVVAFAAIDSAARTEMQAAG
ncbi:MAG: PqqD family protein [Candidatus Sulfotelmatobacter sp.]